MVAGAWDFGGMDDPPPPTPAPTPARKELTESSGKPYLFAIEEWSRASDLKARQKSTYISDVQHFASVHAGITVGSAGAGDGLELVQKWVAVLYAGDIAIQTIKRKLASIRNYWHYLQLHSHAPPGPMYGTGVHLPRERKALDSGRRADNPGIYVDGRVTACGCLDNSSTLVIGDIRTETLRQMRYGARYQALLDAFMSGDVGGLALCADCDVPCCDSRMINYVSVKYDEAASA
jgi:hypothetical protein